jgi:hypothetical protein
MVPYKCPANFPLLAKIATPGIINSFNNEAQVRLLERKKEIAS